MPEPKLTRNLLEKIKSDMDAIAAIHSWHGKPPPRKKAVPGGDSIEDFTTQGIGYWRIQPTLPPDHRYEKILEEFGAKTVKPVSRQDADYGCIIPASAAPAIWLPPAGAFPEPEPETVLEFPKDTERIVGRWKYSVLVRVITKGVRRLYPGYDSTSKTWLQAEPLVDRCLPTYQKWYAGADDPGLDVFAAWVAEIEANPDCCVKHKLLGHYDGTECVGQRKETPPLALIPEETEAKDGGMFAGLFNSQGNFNYYLANGGAYGAGGGNSIANSITVTSPRTGFKLHGILDEP